MGRFLLTVMLGLAIFAGVAWYFDLWPGESGPPMRPKPEDPKGQVEAARQVDVGGPLYPPAPAVKPIQGDAPVRIEPIVIAGQLGVVDKVELSSQVDGALLFIGEEVPDAVVAAAGVAPFMIDPFRYANVTSGDQPIGKFYRRLQQGMPVGAGEMVAMVDPARALLDLGAKRVKVQAAEAEHKAAKGIMDESFRRMQVNRGLLAQRAISPEEYELSKVTYDKYYYEWMTKGFGISVAEAEAKVAQHMLELHQIRNKIVLASSKIHVIYKNSGDAVKANEPIMQLVAGNFLQAEAMVDVVHRDRIRLAKKVTLEPSQEEAPLGDGLKAHHREITSVAVTRDGRILSGSEDGMVRVWSRPKPLDREHNLMTAEQARKVKPWSYTQPEVERELDHGRPVRVVAVSPPASPINWCLVGCNDGSIYLYNLDVPNGEPTVLKQYSDAVTALAFSPDGQWFASGGADNMIYVWRTETGKVAYPFDTSHGVAPSEAHQGAPTSLHFTPQAKLVSAGRDHSLRVWSLHERGARLERREEGRSGNVHQLGVDRDGKWMIYDKQGQELQILAVEGGRYLASLHNPHGTIPFDTMAAFSPDGSLLLTAGAAEGRLQLWQTPTRHSRGLEVRQLAPSTNDRSAATCAAFAPDAGLEKDGDGSFVVTGTKSGTVYVWPVPNKRDVENHPVTSARKAHLAPSQDNVRQVRVTVELANPPDEQHPEGRLTAGRPVTIVIE